MKALLYIALFVASASAACSKDSECSSGSLCIRSLCMSLTEVKYLAEVFAPANAVDYVHS